MAIGVWVTTNNGHCTGKVHFSDRGDVSILTAAVHKRESTNVAQTSVICLA